MTRRSPGVLLNAIWRRLLAGVVAASLTACAGGPPKRYHMVPAPADEILPWDAQADQVGARLCLARGQTWTPKKFPEFGSCSDEP